MSPIDASEGGLLARREIEGRLDLAERLAECLKDKRMPAKVVHRLAEIIKSSGVRQAPK
jgi:hypothetical protein